MSERAAASEPRERSGDRGAPASERPPSREARSGETSPKPTTEAGVGGSAGAQPPGSIKDFESAIAELETIVKQLDDGDLALDKSLALFERGVELSRYCHDQLGAAQRRIDLLTERGDLKDASGLIDTDE